MCSGWERASRCLLLHGTGASVHSWRGLMPLLAHSHEVIAIDLPRHAFTTGHNAYAMSLPAMAGAIAGLVKHLDITPAAIIGHSAGAALALQLALDHGYTGPLVGLNSALRPFPGPFAQIFPAVAKALFINPLVPRIFSGTVDLTGGAGRFPVALDPFADRCGRPRLLPHAAEASRPCGRGAGDDGELGSARPARPDGPSGEPGAAGPFGQGPGNPAQLGRRRRAAGSRRRSLQCSPVSAILRTRKRPNARRS